MNTLVWLLPPGCTDEVQPVGAGCGRLLKVEVGKELDLLLDQNDSLDKWDTNSISSSERRVLIARWVSNAAERTDARPGYCLRLFGNTGWAMTADRSRDDRKHWKAFQGRTPSCMGPRPATKMRTSKGTAGQTMTMIPTVITTAVAEVRRIHRQVQRRDQQGERW